MSSSILRWSIYGGVCVLLLSGCLSPRKQPESTRNYVLSSMPPEKSTSVGALPGHSLGIAAIEIPSYLFGNRMVFRKSDAEVRYSEVHRWAERLDKGIQRVLAANLAILLNSERVELSEWTRSSVKAEIHLSIHRFEFDEQGNVLLEARWRVAAPGGDKTLLTRYSRVVRQASGSSRSIEARVMELNHALTDLSREMADAIARIL